MRSTLTSTPTKIQPKHKCKVNSMFSSGLPGCGASANSPPTGTPIAMSHPSPPPPSDSCGASANGSAATTSPGGASCGPAACGTLASDTTQCQEAVHQMQGPHTTLLALRRRQAFFWHARAREARPMAKGWVNPVTVTGLLLMAAWWWGRGRRRGGGGEAGGCCAGFLLRCLLRITPDMKAETRPAPMPSPPALLAPG